MVLVNARLYFTIPNCSSSNLITATIALYKEQVTRFQQDFLSFRLR